MRHKHRQRQVCAQPEDSRSSRTPSRSPGNRGTCARRSTSSASANPVRPPASARVAAELDVVHDRGLQRLVPADPVEEVPPDEVEDASPAAEEPCPRDVHEPARAGSRTPHVRNVTATMSLSPNDVASERGKRLRKSRRSRLRVRERAGEEVRREVHVGVREDQPLGGRRARAARAPSSSACGLPSQSGGGSTPSTTESDAGKFALEAREDPARPVRRAVVHDDDLEGRIVLPALAARRVLHVALFVPRGDDDRHERRAGLSRGAPARAGESGRSSARRSPRGAARERR